MQKYLALIWYDDIKRFFNTMWRLLRDGILVFNIVTKLQKKQRKTVIPPDVHEKVKLEILSIASSSSSDLSRPFYK
jgi:hypothetical protein